MDFFANLLFRCLLNFISHLPRQRPLARLAVNLFAQVPHSRTAIGLHAHRHGCTCYPLAHAEISREALQKVRLYAVGSSLLNQPARMNRKFSLLMVSSATLFSSFALSPNLYLCVRVPLSACLVYLFVSSHAFA